MRAARKTPSRSSRAQARFPARTLAAYGGPCAACGTTRDVQAHHPAKVRTGGAVAAQVGVALCLRCHPAAEAAS
jgi:hypothetical protein